jgi:hypothetical protein
MVSNRLEANQRLNDLWCQHASYRAQRDDDHDGSVAHQLRMRVPSLPQRILMLDYERGLQQVRVQAQILPTGGQTLLCNILGAWGLVVLGANVWHVLLKPYSNLDGNSVTEVRPAAQ